MLARSSILTLSVSAEKKQDVRHGQEEEEELHAGSQC
jgi:hypothetical protein